MTALLTLERARLTDVFTAAPYSPSPAESLMGLRAGERLTVADLLRGLLIVSANDAAATLAVDVAGSQRRFVALMNRRARQLGLKDTHYANPVGLDEPGNYSSAADLVKLTLVLRQHAFFRATTNLGTVTLHSGSRTRHLVNRNDLVRAVPYVNGVKTGHTNNAGYILVGSATRNGVTLVSAVLGDPSQAARDADTLRLLRYGLSRYHRIVPVRKGAVLGSAALKYRDERVDLVAARSVMRVARARRARHGDRDRRARGDRGADGRGHARRDHPRAPARPGRGPRSRSSPRATSGPRRSASAWATTSGAVRHVPSLAVLAVCSLYLALMWRRLRAPPQRRRGARTGIVIITVTLNAAIDKSLSVPNFRLGRRHRTVEQTTMAGGKGVNVARTLKTLGQPVIATGFAGGPTGTRIVEQLTGESILNDFVRIREESRTNTAVYDPTNGEQTEINERGPAVSEPRSSCSATSCSTSPAARTSSCSPARCRAASTPRSTPS